MFLRPLNNESFVCRVNQLLHRLTIKIHFHSSVYMLEAFTASKNLISYLEVEIFRVICAKIEIAMKQFIKSNLLNHVYLYILIDECVLENTQIYHLYTQKI